MFGPSGRTARPTAPATPADRRRMWTSRLRRRALRVLPPGKLLPGPPARLCGVVDLCLRCSQPGHAGHRDRLRLCPGPGRARLVAHRPRRALLQQPSPVERRAFFVFMVIHLWGKFWMAAWRGGRARDLGHRRGGVHGLGRARFTGYVSQQNFDSQWISTSGKDALNAVGVGAFFNVMNFGQMLMWHIVLIPIVLIAIVGAHVLLVRVRGVSHPIAAHGAEVTGQGGFGGARRRPPTPCPGAARTGAMTCEGGHIASLLVLAPDRGPRRPAVLTRHAARHHRHLGPAGARRLPGHRGQRAERDQRDRHVRPAVQQPERQHSVAAVLPRPTSPALPSPSTPRRTSSSVRCRPWRPPTRRSPPRSPPIRQPRPPSSLSGPTPMRRRWRR